MSIETTKADIEALTDLVQSRGFALYRQMVMAEIAGDFEEHITKALDTSDSTLALDRMRQIAAVRKAGIRWLELPKRKLQELQQGVQAAQAVEGPSRRPMGL